MGAADRRAYLLSFVSPIAVGALWTPAAHSCGQSWPWLSGCYSQKVFFVYYHPHSMMFSITQSKVAHAISPSEPSFS